MIRIKRCPENPIVVPGGKYAWRQAMTFNPAAIEEDGKVYLFERTAATMRPNLCHIGLLVSDDGVHFEHVGDEPVLTPDMVGWPKGSLQDPRVVKIDGTFYMTYAGRPYTGHVGCERGFDMAECYPEIAAGACNLSRSGIATSTDLIHWKQRNFVTPEGLDDRDVILFPEKINGKFAMLRRPSSIGGTKIEIDGAIWVTYSEDLDNWSEPELIARPEQPWESHKIGGSTPPLRTDEGWLTLYHGVDKDMVYRVGALLLDLDDPSVVRARTKVPIMQPQEDYETVLSPLIGNVIFPCGNIVRDGIVHIYYGCCDWTIGLATVPLAALVDFLLLCGHGDVRIER